LIEKKDCYEERENILAIVDGKATIKKLFKGKSGMLLMPASTDKKHKPILVRDNFYIAGRVVSMIPDPMDLSELQYITPSESPFPQNQLEENQSNF